MICGTISGGSDGVRGDVDSPPLTMIGGEVGAGSIMMGRAGSAGAHVGGRTAGIGDAPGAGWADDDTAAIASR